MVEKLSTSFRTQCSVQDREQATETLLKAKRDKNITFEAIAEQLGLNVVYVTTAILGNHTLLPDQVDKLLGILGLSDDKELRSTLEEVPIRASQFKMPPDDPTIYRLYEWVKVYGPSIKHLVHEQCGDGIMSVIGCETRFKKIEGVMGGNPKIQLTIEGTYLPYLQWK